MTQAIALHVAVVSCQLPVGNGGSSRQHVACGTCCCTFGPKANRNMLAKLALRVAPQFSLGFISTLSDCFPSTICLHFCCRINIYLFVFQFHNAHYSLDSTQTHTHTQCRKYSGRSRRRGKDKAELAICPRIDIKIARLLSLWHSDNFAHLCCLLLCAAYQCNCACQLFGCQVKCVHLR